MSTRDPHTLVLKFIVSRFTLYQAIYERLETIGCTMEASKCFRQMVDELVDNLMSSLNGFSVSGLA